MGKIKTEDLINWKQLSKHLSGSDNSIRKNKIPKKYEKKVNQLIVIINRFL